jgi:hypothetical protein
MEQNDTLEMLHIDIIQYKNNSIFLNARQNVYGFDGTTFNYKNNIHVHKTDLNILPL